MLTPTEQQAIACYLQHSAQLARSLPLPTARLFLHGALLIAGEHESIESLREVYFSLRDADSALEPIATGQLQLQLTTTPQPLFPVLGL